MTRTSGPVAVLGLGTMGTGVAGRLLDQGVRVRVWNRTPERTEPLTAAGAFAATRPIEAVEGTTAPSARWPTGTPSARCCGVRTGSWPTARTPVN